MRKRKKIFFIGFFSLIFFISALCLILYSFGYVFDLEKKKIVSTGSFYFKTYPKECEIYLNGKFIKKTDPILGTAIIKNLKPDIYNIEIKKEGFSPWKKELEIKEKFVTEAKNIFLFPKNFNLSLITKDVDNFFIFKENILLKKGGEENWYFTLLNLKDLKEDVVLDKKDFKNEQLSFENLILNEEKAILELKDKKEKYFYLLDISTTPFIILKKINLPKNSENIIFHPSLDEIIFEKEGKFFEYNLKENIISQIFKVDILALFPLKDSFLLLSKDGFLYKNNFEGKIIEILNKTPFYFKENAKYKIISDNNASFIFLKECDQKCTLYSLNREDSSFKKIFENVKDIVFSPKLDKAIIYSNHEIWILFLKDYLEQPIKKEGELIFLNRFSKEIIESSWFNKNYIIFNTDNRVKISEIDNRDGINIVDLVNLENKKIFLTKDFKLLILEKEGKLFYNSIIF